VNDTEGSRDKLTFLTFDNFTSLKIKISEITPNDTSCKRPKLHLKKDVAN